MLSERHLVDPTDGVPPPPRSSVTRSILLSKFSYWTPKRQTEAFDEFRADYGEMTTRSLCRILAELLRDGLVAKDDDHEYIRTRKEPDATDSDTGEPHPRPTRDRLDSLAAVED